MPQSCSAAAKRFSADVLGDAQVVSNIEASRATRLYELYVEGTSPGGGSSLLFGFWDLNSELDVIEPATLFLNTVTIGSRL